METLNVTKNEETQKLTPSDVEAKVKALNVDLEALWSKHGVSAVMALIELPFAVINHEHQTGLTKRLGMIELMKEQSRPMLEMFVRPAPRRPPGIAVAR